MSSHEKNDDFLNAKKPRFFTEAGFFDAYDANIFFEINFRGGVFLRQFFIERALHTTFPQRHSTTVSSAKNAAKPFGVARYFILKNATSCFRTSA